MNIPQYLIDEINKNSDPLDNHYFLHAFSALDSINRVDEKTFCFDDMCRAINTLERLYKGLLYAADCKLSWYHIPDSTPNFLRSDHNLIRIFREIVENFPKAFPRQSHNEWQKTKDLLYRLRKSYTASRYDDYPTYEEFDAVRTYVNDHKDIIVNYIKEGNLEEKLEEEFEEEFKEDVEEDNDVKETDSPDLPDDR